MADTQKILDKSGALARVDGDEELYREILQIFFEDIPLQIKKLSDALSAGDQVTAQRQAHSIKGASANVGAMVLREIAFKMETLAREGALADLKPLLPELDTELAKVNKFATEHNLL